jgi:hypothetical protein
MLPIALFAATRLVAAGTSGLFVTGGCGVTKSVAFITLQNVILKGIVGPDSVNDAVDGKTLV